MNKLKYKDIEPVRVIGWLTTAVVIAASVIKQVTDAYDEGTGWMGLGIAVVMVVATEAQRARVTPVAKLNNQVTGGLEGAHFANEE